MFTRSTTTKYTTNACIVSSLCYKLTNSSVWMLKRWSCLILAQRTAQHPWCHPFLSVMMSETAFSQILRLGLFSAALNICCTQTEWEHQEQKSLRYIDGSYSHVSRFSGSLPHNLKGNSEIQKRWSYEYSSVGITKWTGAKYRDLCRIKKPSLFMCIRSSCEITASHAVC